MRIVACFLLLLAAAAAQPAPPAPVDKGQEVNSKRARALLEQAIQALGGQAYLSVLDISFEGRTYSFYQGRAKGVGGLFWYFWKWPDKDRIEFTKQRDVIYIQNGDKCLETTFRGTRPQSARVLRDYVRPLTYSLEPVLRAWLQERGVALFYDGIALAENKSAERVTVINSKGQSATIYLDKFNSLPIATSFTVRDPETREKVEESESYDNYHLVQGVNIPFTITRKRDGVMVNQKFINHVVYNSGLQDSLFSPAVTYDPDAKKRQSE